MNRTLIAVIAACGVSMFPLGCAGEVAYQRPAVRYEAPPPLVEVEPGVQVVPEQEQEVFFNGGAYWTRRDGHWWHSPDHRGNWVVAEDRVVPVQIRAYPEGRYRRYPAGEHRVVPIR